MSHNCTARNCFFLKVFRCSAWHVVSEILRPIGRTAAKIAAEWSGRSPFRLGVPEVCLPKLVRKTLPCCSEAMLPMIASFLGSSASEHRFRCSEALLQMVDYCHTLSYPAVLRE